MVVIDSRLLSPDTDQDVTENFNRVLGMIDKLSESIEELQPEPEETNETTEGE